MKYFNDGQLVIPTYQRGIVWNQEKQLKLMKSVFEGLPVGALLVWQTTGNNKVMYHLIDGLQRTTTILEFLKVPLRYVHAELLDDSVVASLVQSVQESVASPPSELQVLAELRAWIASVPSTTDQNFTSYRLASKLLAAFAEAPTIAAIERLEPSSASVLSSIRDQISVEDYKIPVIVYEGAESELPGIFERINSEGTPLSKYQKFAASWASQQTTIANPAIRMAVRDKYKQLEDHGYVVADFDPYDPDYEYDLFEYLFGLGKLVSQQYPALLSPSDGVTDVESASFSIATISHGLRMADMNKLPQYFSRNDETINPERFEAVVLGAVDAVDRILRPVYRLRLNTTSGADAKLALPELQVLSFICALIAHRYAHREFEQRTDWAGEWQGAFRAPLLGHLLIDIVQQNWRGSGDSRIFTTTWQDAEGQIPGSHYATPPVWNYVEQILDAWFEESLRSEQRDRASIRSIEKLLMRFIYMKRLSVADNEHKVFEIDHILPVRRLAQLIPDGEGWPISNIANLTLLEKDDNRRKATQTLREYVDALSSEGKDEIVARIDHLALHPITACDISLPVGHRVYTKETYIQFLRSRWIDIKSALREALQ